MIKKTMAVAVLMLTALTVGATEKRFDSPDGKMTVIVNDEGGNFQCFDEGTDGSSASLETEGEHTAAALVIKVFADALKIWARFESRIADPIHGGVLGQKFCQCECVVTVLWHSQMERFKAQIQKECVERA